jgi:hypothetical protein
MESTRHRRARVIRAARLTVAAIAVVAVCASAAQAAGTHSSGDWHWTPGLCKSVLKQRTIELADGRTFNVADSYCVGVGGLRTCMWSSGYRYRLYNEFVAFTRAYDGTVRSLRVYVTDRRDGRVADIRAYGREADGAAFRTLIAPVAEALARRQHDLGCASR